MKVILIVLKKIDWNLDPSIVFLKAHPGLERDILDIFAQHEKTPTPRVQEILRDHNCLLKSTRMRRWIILGITVAAEQKRWKQTWSISQQKHSADWWLSGRNLSECALCWCVSLSLSLCSHDSITYYTTKQTVYYSTWHYTTVLLHI